MAQRGTVASWLRQRPHQTRPVAVSLMYVYNGPLQVCSATMMPFAIATQEHRSASEPSMSMRHSARLYRADELKEDAFVYYLCFNVRSRYVTGSRRRSMQASL